MNIIHTLPCGCHRGLCECPVASHLHTTMDAAYDKTEVLPLSDEGYLTAWRTYDQCYQAYTTHIEQCWVKVVILV